MRIRHPDYTLLAQAIAIVLPVAALSGIALHFLKEDRAAIDREAVVRAQAELPVEVAALQQLVKNGVDHGAVTATIRNGALWILGDYPQVPEPAWTEAASAAELPLFEGSNSPDVVARAVALGEGVPATYRTASGVPIRVRALEVALRGVKGGALPPYVLTFLRTTVFEYPDQAPGLLRLAGQESTGPSAAMVERIQQDFDHRRETKPAAPSSDPYADLQRLEAGEKRGVPDLVSQSVALASRTPASVTPAGTPIGPLALLIGLRHVDNGALSPQMLAALRGQVVSYPSFLTTELLHAAGEVAKGESATRVAAIADEWRLAEEARENKRTLIRTIAAQLVGGAWPPPAILPEGPGGEWIALCDRWYDGWAVRLIPNLRPRPPKSYLGLTVQIDRLHWRLAGPDNPKSKVLALATGILNDTQQQYTVRIDLADPDQLYRPYQRRLLLTRSLICCAALTALIGLASLWISYQHQVRLSEMKSNFVSSVSHELRAPLAAVRLMAESLDGGRVVEEDKRRDYYRLIVQECRRLSGLVENVLDVSRIGDGRKTYRFEPVDLAALLRRSVALMEPCAAERQLTLRLPPGAAAGLKPCWDAEAVEQSLVNLLDNAIKHSPAGSTVEIGVQQADGKIRLWVEDSGPGIPIPEQKRIFDLFYRRGTELRRETKGVGIGLTIVRSVAEAHGGRVIVDSEVGRGSRFSLELPMEHSS